MATATVPSLVWTAAAEPGTLAPYVQVDFDALLREVVEPARRTALGRTSLANPAQAWLDRVRASRALALCGVRLDSLEDLQVLHGYVLEPAWRAGTPLLVECPQRLSQLDPAAFADPAFRHAYTLDRALYAAHRIWRPDTAAVSGAPSPSEPLDDEQLRAVAAPGGTIQVIAPAGSGKTTVLVERVRELLRRGVAPARILATTFNRNAASELKERLGGAVEARTLHGLGLLLLREEGWARPDVRSASLNEFKRLCALAARDTGTWVEPGTARAAVSQIKLGLIATPAEFAAEHTGELPDGETIAHVYARYEEVQAQRRANDFDDHIMLAVRALREDAELRSRWQARFTHVLVDEYQDIEPAQELLVRILAAPQDELFCVGDDDQTLYGFRRASVRRMIDLDLAYPGLARVALAHNYRCPPRVVTASRRLIDRNALRFPKAIDPAPGRTDARDAIVLVEPDSQAQGAALVAAALAASRRGEIVVLARTTNLLRTVALACADAGVRISAPPRVFDAQGARKALEAYLRLCGEPSAAEAEDVATVCRMPNRGLPFEAQAEVADLLRAGFSFTESLAAPAADQRQRVKLDQAGRVLDALAGMDDAGRFVRYLRTAGGLDEYFAEHDDGFGATEQIELEVLEQASTEAAGKTVGAFAALQAARTDALRDVRDDAAGVELSTIHGAKGRQWPRVELFACDETQLPHRRALDVTEAQRATGEGEEAERRLAYVAFTRARQELVITAAGAQASRFLTEAGLSPKRPYRPPEPPPPTPAPRSRVTAAARATPRVAQAPSGHAEPRVAEALHVAERTGLDHALRTTPDRAVALETAATALERHTLGPGTASERMTVAKLLAAVSALEEAERTRAITGAGVRESALVGRLDPRARRRLAKALRELLNSA